MSCSPILLQPPFKFFSIGFNIRGFGHSYLIKDNIPSEKTKDSFVNENQKNRKKMSYAYILVKSAFLDTFNLFKSK